MAAAAIAIGAIVLVNNDQSEAEKQAQANREIKEEMQRQAEEASEKMKGGSATVEDILKLQSGVKMGGSAKESPPEEKEE